MAEDKIPAELRRFQTALVQTRGQIVEVQKKVSKGLGAGDAAIFDAHLLVLEDQTLIDEGRPASVRDRPMASTSSAFQEGSSRTLRRGVELPSRTSISGNGLGDMQDVTSRVLDQSVGRRRRRKARLARLKEPGLHRHQRGPAPLGHRPPRQKAGPSASPPNSGSKTSHTSIMARAMQIPAVVGTSKTPSTASKTGGYALLDGYHGQIILNPTDQTLFEYGQLVRKQVNLLEKLQDLRDKPAVTLDGTKIHLSANIEKPADVSAVLASGADGVGLFRTEYLFINRDTLPSEEEQYEAYQQVAAALHPRTVVIRHDGPRRRQISPSHLHPLPEEAEPVSGLAGDPPLRSEERDLFLRRSSARHSPGQRREERPNDVPDDLQPPKEPSIRPTHWSPNARRNCARKNLPFRP